jgi:AAA+ ATPase superfamily predicted ATPase
MDARLIDRDRELAALETSAAAPGGQLVIVWGRRRAGKTYLLQAFLEQRRCIYYAATQQSAGVELAAFTDVARATMGEVGLPPGYVFPNWSIALDFIATTSGPQRLVVILDEFPYLAASTPGLESIVQRWWDQRGRQSHVMLVLCGSAVAYMHQIMGAAAPLHQRATASIAVAALDYRAAGDFVPVLPAAERAVVYGILGGTPLYLAQWNANLDRRANLINLFGSATSPLVDAAELVLSGELPELEGAFRVLQAVALGRTRPSEIAAYAKVAVERPLKRLLTLGILERRIPALEDAARSKRGIYRIVDPYFAFWFRFIAPNRAHIARGLGAQLVDGRILPHLDDHMGAIFEEMARDHARGLAAQGQLEAERIDSWWSTDGAHEIDLVGVRDRDRVSFVGTVKWSARPLGREVLTNLDDHSAALPGYRGGTLRLVYGRTACGATLAREPLVRCFSVEDMYGEQGEPTPTL